MSQHHYEKAEEILNKIIFESKSMDGSVLARSYLALVEITLALYRINGESREVYFLRLFADSSGSSSAVCPTSLKSNPSSTSFHFSTLFLQRHDSSFHSQPNLLPLPHRSNALFPRAGQRQRRKKRGIPADSIPSRSNPPPISSSPSPANPTRRFSTSCACSATRPTRFGRFFSTESTISTPTP